MMHLHTHSWFSFLAAASGPDMLATRAADLGHPALALTDDWTLAGAARHARACAQQGITPLFGARVVVGGVGLVLLAADQEGYANLCDLLTLAHLTRRERREHEPQLTLDQLAAHREGVFCLADVSAWLKGGRLGVAEGALRKLKGIYADRLFTEVVHHRRAGDSWLLRQVQALAAALSIPIAATNAVRHAHAHHYALFDALSCARLGLTVAESHPARPINDAAFLCDEAELLGRGLPTTALANTDALARECRVSLLAEGVLPPEAHLPQGATAPTFLRDLCRAGLKHRGLWRSTAAREQLRREVQVISALELEEFFLVVREVVEFARSRGIRCSGRGSAANSLVAYLLGITEVDPLRHNLLFERFLHEGRKGMPDIDVDFETHRRDEVIGWMAGRWGEAHTAMTANVVTFRLRMAVREMGKVLGFPLPMLDRAAQLLPHADAHHVGAYRRELAIGLCGGTEPPALDVLCQLVEQLDGCPRHLSLHSGGMILSRQPLRYLSPIQTSTNGVRQMQFDKSDAEALGLIKFDVLGLRMLSVVTEAVQLVKESGQTPADVDALPEGDTKTYDLIRSGRTLGLFQIESPGQWDLLSRSQPQNFDDLVAQVALFRPGPLQGNMVHPYVARRRGWQPVSYLHPSLEPALRDSYGIILYQEQVLEVAHAFAGLSLQEADEFRRLMSKFRNASEMEAMREKFVGSAIETHKASRPPVTPALANRVFDLVAKFVGYGFCRSHAAAFARTVYQSAYLKAHHPTAYMAAVLEHKPGFYPVHTLLEEARLFGVKVLPPCLLKSGVKYDLEKEGKEAGAIRVPLTQVKEIAPASAAHIVLERTLAPLTSVEDAVEKLTLEMGAWENLARAGALDAFCPRREALWRVRAALRRKPHGDQVRLPLDENDAPTLKPLTPAQLGAWDFSTQGLTTGPHPLALLRPDLSRLFALTIGDLARQTHGAHVMVAGAVISRQRPPTANGMAFLVIEDETGRLPAAVPPPCYEKFREALREPGLFLEGKLEAKGSNDYRSLLVTRAWPLQRAVTGYQPQREQEARQPYYFRRLVPVRSLWKSRSAV